MVKKICKTFLKCKRHAIIIAMNTRQSVIAVVRRLFKIGAKTVERRLKTLRRLFHPSPAEMRSMLIYDDAYFPFLLFYMYFLSRAQRGNFFGVDPVWTLKKWPMLKNSATLIPFLPRHRVADAYSRRRQILSGE